MRRTGLLLIVLISFLILFLAPFRADALDPQQPIERYLMDEWNENNGLNSFSIYYILQSSDGFLWIEGSETVYRFDGRRFSEAHRLRLPYSDYSPKYVYSVFLKDKEGSIWLTADCGILKYRDNRFQDFYCVKNFPWEEFSMALEDSWGNYWMGTSSGYLYSLKNQKLTTFGVKKGIPLSGITCILEDMRGVLWVSTVDRGIFKMNGDRFIPVQVEGITSRTPVTWLYEDQSGNLWIGTEKGVARMINATVDWFTVEQGLSDNLVTDIIEDSDGNLWVGTNNGLNRLRSDQQGNITIDHRLDNIIINLIYEDKEKNLWVGTEGSGLKRLRDRMLLTVTVNTNRQDYISALHYTRSGEIWAGNLYGDLTRIEKIDSNGAPTIRERLACHDYITSLCDDLKGNLWAGTLKNGLFCITPQRQLIHYTDDIKLRQIYSLYCDSRNRLWIGTRSGVVIYNKNTTSYSNHQNSIHENHHRYENTGIHINHKDKPESLDQGFFTYQDSQGMPDYAVQYISEDEDGHIWLGSFNGLVKLEKGEIRKENIQKILNDDSVSFIFPDQEKNGTLLIGSYGRGLIRKKGNDLFYYSKKTRMPFDSINMIMADEFGYLWFSSSGGICRMSRKELDDMADGKSQSVTVKTFGVFDGLKSSECTGSSYNAAIKLPNGEYWFATKKGIAVFRPEKVTINKSAPRVFIEDVQVNGKPVNIQTGETPFQAGEVKRIRFNFTAPAYSGQERVFFKFRLEKHEEEWSRINPGERRTVEYTNLPNGSYSFRVTACNSDGVWNGEGTRFPFTVSPGFFKSTLFVILLFIVLSVVGLAISWWVYRQKKERSLTKKAHTEALDTISSDKYLVKLLQLLEEEKVYRDESVSINSLSRKMMISPRLLSRLINEKLDKSFYDLINHYRIEEAKQLLLAGSNAKAILEIAFDIGFNTKSSFNRAFKKETGLTPSQFKKQKNHINQKNQAWFQQGET